MPRKRTPGRLGDRGRRALARGQRYSAGPNETLGQRWRPKAQRGGDRDVDRREIHFVEVLVGKEGLAPCGRILNATLGGLQVHTWHPTRGPRCRTCLVGAARIGLAAMRP